MSVGRRRPMRSFNSPHKFSIGDKSGEYGRDAERVSICLFASEFSGTSCVSTLYYFPPAVSLALFRNPRRISCVSLSEIFFRPAKFRHTLVLATLFSVAAASSFCLARRCRPRCLAESVAMRKERTVEMDLPTSLASWVSERLAATCLRYARTCLSCSMVHMGCLSA